MKESWHCSGTGGLVLEQMDKHEWLMVHLWRTHGTLMKDLVPYLIAFERVLAQQWNSGCLVLEEMLTHEWLVVYFWMTHGILVKDSLFSIGGNAHTWMAYIYTYEWLTVHLWRTRCLVLEEMHTHEWDIYVLMNDSRYTCEGLNAMPRDMETSPGTPIEMLHHSKTLQHIEMLHHSNTLQHIYCNTLQYTFIATHSNTLQHIHCNIWGVVLDSMCSMSQS